MEGILKKATEDIAKLESEHASAIKAHVLAAKERYQQVIRLEGEILSLNQVIASTCSPQRLQIEDIPREVQVEYMFNYMRSKAFEVTCRRFHGYFLGQGFSLLRERLYEMDPSINLREMKMFEGEHMLNNRRTLLRFPRPRTDSFIIYLLGDELPASDDDRVVSPLPFYASPNRVPDELLDHY